MIKELEDEVKRRERERRPIPLWLRFHILLTEEGRLYIVGHRKPRVWWNGEGRPPRPFRIVALDVNSRHGVAVIAFDVLEDGVRKVHQERPRPKNATRNHKLIKLLDKYIADPANQELREKLLQRLPKGLKKVFERRPTAECAREIRFELYKGMRKNRVYWVYETVGLVRRLVREAPEGRAIIIIDTPEYSSIHGTELQKTLLSIGERIKVLALYEGVPIFEWHPSGKRCPLCRAEGQRLAEKGILKRYYECPSCKIVFNRDWCAVVRAAAALAPEIREWVKQHPTTLAPNIDQLLKNAERPPVPRPSS